MKYLSLFSGIEAATVAWETLGFEPVAFAEFEDFPKAVLAHYYPNVPDLGDVTKITKEQIVALGLTRLQRPIQGATRLLATAWRFL